MASSRQLRAHAQTGQLTGLAIYVPPNSIIGVVDMLVGREGMVLDLLHRGEVIASTAVIFPGASMAAGDGRPAAGVFAFALPTGGGRIYDEPMRVIDRATGIEMAGGEVHGHLSSEENAATPWIPALGLPSARRVLVVAPHPDDESILFGGLILRYRRIGVPVTIVTMTDGSWDKQVEGSEIRWREQEEALEILDCLDSRRFGYGDRKLELVVREAAGRLAGVIEEVDPELIVCPSPVDWHRDHIATAEIVDRACKETGKSRNVAFGEFYSLIKPNLVVDISGVVERKRAACEAYRSQLELRQYADAAIGLNRYRALASEIGCEAAEAYCLVRCDGKESAIAAFGIIQRGGVLAGSLRVDWTESRSSRVVNVLNGDGEMPDIDLSMVAYESADALQSYLQSLAKVDYPLEKLHLYFVDHSPDEDTILALRAAEVRWGGKFGSFVIERRRNVGFGAGHNFNTWKGVSPYVLIVNIDLTFKADALKQVMRVVLDAPAKDVAWEFNQQPYEHPKIYDPVSLAVDWASAACLLFRREAYAAVGGFDESIFLYGEDTDLSYRIKNRGWFMRYCPQAIVYHHADDEVAERAQHRHIAYSSLLLRVRYGTRADILHGWRNLPKFKWLQERFGLGRGLLLRERISLVGSCLRFWFGRGRYRLPHRPSALRWFEDESIVAKVRKIRKPPSRKSGKLFGPMRFKPYDFCFTRKGAYVRNDKVLSVPEPLVTVIIRTEGRRVGLLREALSSIANQTYRNIEVLVVEDGGETLSGVIAGFCEDTGLDVRLVPISKGGRSVAGNVGLSLARGEFINFLDDDDLLFADHIEVLVKELAVDSGAPAAYGWALEVPTIIACGQTPVYRESGPRHVHNVLFSRSQLKRYNFLPIQTVLFRADLYRTRGGFDASLEMLEDWDLWRRYAAAGDFLCVQKSTSAFRVPGDQVEYDRRHEQFVEAGRRLAELRNVEGDQVSESA